MFLIIKGYRGGCRKTEIGMEQVGAEGLVKSKRSASEVMFSVKKGQGQRDEEVACKAKTTDSTYSE